MEASSNIVNVIVEELETHRKSVNLAYSDEIIR
jgi:hypothetical protein